MSAVATSYTALDSSVKLDTNNFWKWKDSLFSTTAVLGDVNDDLKKWFISKAR